MQWPKPYKLQEVNMIFDLTLLKTMLEVLPTRFHMKHRYMKHYLVEHVLQGENVCCLEASGHQQSLVLSL